MNKVILIGGAAIVLASSLFAAKPIGEVLKTHEGVIEKLMDKKAEKSNLKSLQRRIGKLEQKIIQLSASSGPVVQETELYDSRFDKKFKAYLADKNSNPEK